MCIRDRQGGEEQSESSNRNLIDDSVETETQPSASSRNKTSGRSDVLDKSSVKAAAVGSEANERKRKTPLQVEQESHAQTREELSDLNDKHASAVSELEAHLDAGAPDEEISARFKELHNEVDVLKAQLAAEVEKSSGLIRENAALKRRLHLLETEE